MNYPYEIIAAYAGRKITRAQFHKQFRDWQKSRGINYDCAGTGDRNGIYLTYRGVVAEVRGGVIRFTTDAEERADSVFEFQRKVDFAVCRRLRSAAWS